VHHEKETDSGFQTWKVIDSAWNISNNMELSSMTSDI
jgi:hypothetical protein